ncbi:MAG: hypothetical protein KAR80_08215 [Rhodospirillaceae bacterium]|nr:hypothetical protein [Rhodospirillaceae bacterium]
MDQLTSDAMLSIALAITIFTVFKFMPRILAGVPFHGPDVIKGRMDNGDNILVIDVRSGAEFTGELGHVPGSINLDATAIEDKVKELGEKLSPHKDSPVVVACRTHNRSPRVAKFLKGSGFKDVSVLKGGVTAWSKAGYPTERKA